MPTKTYIDVNLVSFDKRTDLTSNLSDNCFNITREITLPELEKLNQILNNGDTLKATIKGSHTVKEIMDLSGDVSLWAQKTWVLNLTLKKDSGKDFEKFKDIEDNIFNLIDIDDDDSNYLQDRTI